MRAPAVFINVIIAGALSGVVGYGMANRAKTQEITQLQQERDRAFIRERELRAQVQEALAARAVLTQETQRLQKELLERLRRLEEAAAKLTPPAKSELRNEH